MTFKTNFMKSINWKLCLIADQEAVRKTCLIPKMNEALKAGVTIVQLRAKKLKTREFLKLALKTSDIVKSRNLPFIINDRIDIVLSCDADGVHLGQEDIPLPFARKILGENKLIGISVNTEKEAVKAEYEGADYLGVGPIFPTSSKDNLRPLLGLDGLQTIRNKVNIPILAIGGINRSNAAKVIDSGADGIAVISAILGAKDISKATKELIYSINHKT